MKTLTHYTEEAQTKLFEETGTFFAFNSEQFNKGAKKVGADKENKITSLGSGIYVLSKNKDILINGLDKIQEEGIKKDIEENGIKNIIHRELGNYETQITGDITEVIEVLKDYKITEEQVLAEYKSFYQNCIDNDYF